MTAPLRIAVTNWTDRIAGGAERYLSRLIPQLRALGHEVGILAERSKPESRELIAASSRSWNVDQAGGAAALQSLRDWRPDVVFQNGLGEVALEAELLGIAPAVLLAHSYYGACVSGTKTWQSVPRACTRPLGVGCLLHYYPHRCGGLNPATMMRQFALQSRRKSLLHRYAKVVVLSAHMREEYSRDRILATLVPLLGYERRPDVLREHAPSDPWRLLFAGRLQSLKGGHLLIEALREVRHRVSDSIELTLVGDGPDQRDWEERAASIERTVSGVRISFTGWLEGGALDEQWRRADLVVVPSIWPEPLGLVGADAAAHGVPAVAFRTGGIPEWIEDGLNGVLAPVPPTVEGLAGAIVRAIGSEEAYATLARGASERAVHADFVHHAGALSELFREAVSRRRTS